MLWLFCIIEPKIDQIWAWLHRRHRWAVGVWDPLKRLVIGSSLLVNCYLEKKMHNKLRLDPPPPLNRRRNDRYCRSLRRWTQCICYMIHCRVVQSVSWLSSLNYHVVEPVSYSNLTLVQTLICQLQKHYSCHLWYNIPIKWSKIKYVLFENSFNSIILTEQGSTKWHILLTV